MNRPKKFRVWDIKNKKFLPESHFAILGNGKLIVTNSGYYEHFTNTNQDDYVIQDYTGCHDSSNKKIYEDDIFEHKNGDFGLRGVRTGYVGQMAGIFLLSYWDRSEDALGYLPVSNIKIIGNRFENPELLK